MTNFITYLFFIHYDIFITFLVLPNAAWSSVREPSQVFTLLETLFHAFDSIAQRRKVFKVET